MLSRKIVDVVDRYPIEEVIASGGKEPEGVVVGENGKLWVQGKVLGSVVVAGSTACLELQVKNHSTKKVLYLFSPFVKVLFLISFSSEYISDTLTNPYTIPTVLFYQHDTISSSCSSFRHANNGPFPRTRVHYPSRC